MMSNTSEIFDTLIVGAGPIGLACGIECCKKNLSYLIVDKGCLVNSLYHYPLNMTFFSTSEKLEIGNVPFISNNSKAMRPEALEYYRRVAMNWTLNVHLYECVIDAVRNEEGVYTIYTSKGSYCCHSLILATGFYDLPNKMHIPGEELQKVSHYFQEAHPFFARKLAVIGAANSAVDVALEAYRKGAQVTMIIKGNEFLDNVKYWVKPDIENRIKEGSIKAFFNSTVSHIYEKELEINTPDGTILIENDFVMAMTGYLPDFSFLKKLGIAIHDDAFSTPIYNEHTMETNQPNIYLAGVICGGMNTRKWFIENSRVHAEMIIMDILQKKLSNYA